MVNKFDAFTRGYLIAALWTTDDDAGSGEWSEHDNWTIDNIAPDALQEAIEECAVFQIDNGADLDLAGDAERNGVDFWLTRNHHGAGFWDRGYGDVGERLTDAANVFGTVDLYRGDDGQLYFA